MAEEQTCITCQWYCIHPTTFRDKEMEAIHGPYGHCRKNAPTDRGWPTTWGSYWCGECEERKRGPVIIPKDPNE